MKRIFSLISCVALIAGCAGSPSVESEVFGTLSTGEVATIWHLENASGASMDVTDYGCRIVRICMPDRNGKIDDVVVGYGDLESFEKKDRFLGPVIGRFGNRIDNASFVLDGVRYDVDANERFDGEPVQCHGGRMGFDKFVWKGEAVKEENRVGVRFHRLSPDGEQGFPGNMHAYVTYWLTDDNVVKLEYEATTDKPTVVNLSNHTYFNLRGREGCYVMGHLLQVEADTCVQNNTHFCPDKLLHVQGTPFDFREPHRVDYRIDMPNEHLRIMKGMSACWVVRDWDGTLRKAADLYDKKSGRGVETWTTEPALLTFTGRTFSAEGYPDGKYGPIEKFGGMLLETIHFPDSPNQDRFPSTVLRPGEKYHSMTEYRFYAR
jgi:aldose 1-epimerase